MCGGAGVSGGKRMMNDAQGAGGREGLQALNRFFLSCFICLEQACLTPVGARGSFVPPPGVAENTQTHTHPAKCCWLRLHGGA